MDYIVFSAVSHFGLCMYNFSYDIACQWHKKLWTHMLNVPECLQLNYTDKIVCFFVPKLHLKVHVQTCQTRFSFNFTRWVGCTDREAPECGWANFNHMASITKEMGPGSRWDHLDDHFSNSNWKKSIAMGKAFLDDPIALILVMLAGWTMLHKLTKGLQCAEHHRQELEEIEATIEPWNWGNGSLTWQLGIKTWLGQKWILLRIKSHVSEVWCKRKFDALSGHVWSCSNNAIGGEAPSHWGRSTGTSRPCQCVASRWYISICTHVTRDWCWRDSVSPLLSIWPCIKPIFKMPFGLGYCWTWNSCYGLTKGEHCSPS